MPYSHPVDVRYLEVDAQGVVFNMWYLAYLDDAMTGFLAAGGLGYGEMTAAGFDVQLVHTELDWRGAAGFGDTLAVDVRTESIGRTSLTLGFTVRRDEQVLATARTVYVCIGTDGSGSRPVPAALRTTLEGSLT